jgi:hypothetical protein
LGINPTSVARVGWRMHRHAKVHPKHGEFLWRRQKQVSQR